MSLMKGRGFNEFELFIFITLLFIWLYFILNL